MRLGNRARRGAADREGPCANRHQRRIELRKMSMFATALILIGLGGWSMRTAPRVEAARADAIYPLGLMTNAKDLPEAHYVDYTVVFN